MDKKHKLIILGDSVFAQIAYEYFTYDSEYQVVAFSVEKNYLKNDKLFDLPIVAFEKLNEIYPPAQHKFFAALVFSQRNKLRARLYHEAKAKGYSPASYISPRAFVWRNVEIGEHCFILEDNVVQPFAKIGNNVILWSSNHIGHHSTIKDHCFVMPSCVISGFVELGEYCAIGSNTTIANNLVVGNNCQIETAATVLASVEKDSNIEGIWRGKKD
jgi:sugar O-acyltransferase (sialic acid O-acetyltransferase NeuD family)